MAACSGGAPQIGGRADAAPRVLPPSAVRALSIGMDPDTLAGSPAVAADHSKVARGSRADPAGMAPLSALGAVRAGAGKSSLGRIPDQLRNVTLRVRGR